MLIKEGNKKVTPSSWDFGLCTMFFATKNIVPLALGKLAKLESCNSESGGSFEV
jgi:hypothetical protein